ncbi:MAG: hypothetical protein GY812_05230 [Actinomycetia bacterium]|nr:hypothetical protein [Actinomycetes bacterium]
MNVADLLARRLAELGVRRCWGERIPVGPDATDGFHGPALPAHVPVSSADLAVLLADADGRIGEVDGRARFGAALLPGPILHLSSEPGGMAPLQTVGSPEEMLDALVDPAGLVLPGTTALHLDLELSAEVPVDTSASAVADRQPVLTLDPSMAGMRFMVVAGTGVVRTGAFDGVRSASRSLGAGVLNTWGAKGIERWDSPWHFGTVGLQQRDLELAGLDDVDVVVTSGLDDNELGAGVLAGKVVQDVHPGQLGALCARWETGGDAPAQRPPLYGALAEVITPLYEDDGAPLSPARAALHLSGALPERAMAVADAGAAGLWVARAFPTSIPNSVCVPATNAPGFAAAAALCCVLEGRPVLAVTDEPGIDSAESGAVLALAEELGAPVRLQVWREGGPAWSGAADHVALIESELAATQVGVDEVPVRLGDTAAIESVAGPVVAWTNDA